MKPKTIRAAIVAALTIAASAALPLQSFAGAKQTTLLCTGYTGTTTLTDFQTLVRLNDGTYGFHYADCATNDGTDVWFSSDPEGNNVLEREIDTWNTSGESFVWVKIPTVTPVSQGITSITMHWGDSSTTFPAHNTAVWSGFAGVWHMGAASGATLEPDMTGNGLNATPDDNSTNKGDIGLMTASADGVIGGCRTNTTKSTIGNALKVPSYKNMLNDFNTFTISGWFYQTDSLPNTYRLFCSRAATTSSADVFNGWELTSPDASKKPSGVTDTDTVYRDCYVARVTSGKTSITTFQAATKVENLVNRWAHYCVMFEGKSMKAYVDGAKVNEGTIKDTLPTANDNGFWIGRFGNRANPFIGKYDEVRMYNGVLSADRVKADYDTMNTPNTFLTSPTDPIIAVWTGEANNNNFSDPGNWSCTNIVGGALYGAVPDANTEKYILGADADWTSTNLTLAAGVTLDLNGHKLYTSGIVGSAGSIGDTNYVTNGSFENGHNVNSGAWAYARNITFNNFGWTGDSGISRETGTWKQVAAPGGSAVWFFQSAKQVSTTVNVPESGFYTVTFYYGARGSDYKGGEIHVDVGAIQDCGKVTCSAYNSNTTQATVSNVFFKKGDNTLTLRHTYTSGDDICSWIDLVTVKRETSPVVCDSSSDAANPGELHVVVGENTETTIGGTTLCICDNLRIVKEGSGTLTPPAKGWYFTGGIDVQTGTFSMSGPVISFFGKTLGDVSVASGAKASIAAADGMKYGEAFTLNGGTLELVCSGTAEPVTTYITNSVALNAGAKIRFDTSSLTSLTFLLSTDGFTLGEGVESAVSCAERSAPTETIAEASGANGILVTVVAAPVTAVWTGAANNNDFNDPDNWSCTNVLGGALSGAAPDANTEKYILGADADWTSTNLTLAAGVTLDLNGHNLVVANITGSGTVVDLANDPDHTFYADVNGIMYLEMEYLQTTGTYSGNSYNWGNQYIDTGYHHNSNTVTDVKVALIGNTSNWYCYYGARDGYNDNQFGGWIHGTKHYKAVQAAEGDLSKTFTVNVPFVTHLEQNGPCTIDGWQFDTGKGNTSGNLTDWLFAINHNNNVGGSYMAKARMYYCVIQEKDGENLVVMRNFRPVMRISDGKPGMLDIENGVFYVNARTGDDFLVLPVKKSSTPAASSVTFSVADETTLSLANVAPICGNVKVVKAGAGTLTVPTMGVYFTGGIDVSAGTLSIAGPVTSLEGSNLGNVMVASGAKVTIPAIDGLKYGEAFTLNGGTLELVCSGTAVPVTTYITNSVALNAGAKIRFDTTALDSTQFKLSTIGFALGEGVASAVSCAELSSPTETVAEADGANGIIVTVLTEPATATYTGLGTNPLDFTDPDNWACTNAVGGELTGKIPTSNTAVTIPGDTAFQLASGGTMFDCLNVKFENVTFDDGADLRGFDFSKLASGSRIDLQGRTLYVANAAVSGLTITDSTGDTEHPGELHWTVASGTYTNDKTALSGNMKFVKEGLGTFVGAKAQTYTGDTIIAAGTARPPDGDGTNTTYCRDQFKAFGTGSIRVSAGATFDLRANYAYYGWVKLDGGTLTNSGNDMTGTTLGGSGIGEITAESTLNVAHHIVFQGNTFNLNGHTLNVTILGRDWYIHTTTFTNGTVNITQGGWLHTVKNAIDAHTVDFKMNCAINLEQNLDVRNYEALYSDSGYNRGSGTMNVHGTFKPSSHNLFYGCTLLDGSTIDLTNRTVATLPMPTTAAFSNSTASYVDGKKTLSFATGNENGTTVTVSFGGKTKDELKAIAENEVDGKTGMLLTWTSEPAADVKFKADAATSALGFKVKRVEGGVRLLKDKGITIIVK